MNSPRPAPRTLHDAARTLFTLRGWILAALFLFVLAARLLTPVEDAALRPQWLIYVIAAAVLRLWAGAHLGEHGNDAQAHAPRLSRTGPYRFSRNPLYIANILAAAGIVLFANALPLPFEFTLIAAVILHHFVLVNHEEKILATLHSEEYERYRKDAPRWYGLMRPQGVHTQHVNGGGRVTVSALLRRQGRNVGYLALCVLALWAATLVAGTLRGA